MKNVALRIVSRGVVGCQPRPDRPRPGRLSAVCLAVLLAGCAPMAAPLLTPSAGPPAASPADPLSEPSPVAGPGAVPGAVPGAAATAVPPAASAAPADSGWVAVEPGFDRRTTGVAFAQPGLLEQVVLFRIDPARYRLRVLYAPGFPRPVAAWDRQARLVFNAGYFDENDAALGLVVSDGFVFGRSYAGFGGMLAIDAGGAARVRSLLAEPYQPGEALSQAVQGFPMLVRPDGTLFADDDGQRARRTAVGQDAEGRLVVVVGTRGAFTLAGLAAWLAEADLGLAVALNLDGGSSTGYYAGANDSLDSLAPVPAVVAVYPAGGE